MGSTAVADFGISILLSAPTYTLTQIQLAQVYVDTQGQRGSSLPEDAFAWHSVAGARHPYKRFPNLIMNKTELKILSEILIVIVSTEKYLDRQQNILRTWGRNTNILIASDGVESRNNKFIMSSGNDYSSAEDKAINIYNCIRVLESSYLWIFIVDDDTFVSTSNLCRFVRIANSDTVYGSVIDIMNSPNNPVFDKFGCEFRYLSGGAGILIPTKLIIAYPPMISSATGFSDVSFGVHFNRFNIPITNSNLFNQYPPTPNKGIDKFAITYHYIKTLEAMFSLTEFVNPDA
jgi:hypothetical protein